MDKDKLTSRNGMKLTVNSTGKATVNNHLLNKLLRYCGVYDGKIVRPPQVNVDRK